MSETLACKQQTVLTFISVRSYSDLAIAAVFDWFMAAVTGVSSESRASRSRLPLWGQAKQGKSRHQTAMQKSQKIIQDNAKIHLPLVVHVSGLFTAC